MYRQFNMMAFNILDFGAVNDGKTLNTRAFSDAIEACSKAGGGTVFVPAGRFLTGPVHMKSNITLHLDAGAVLLFSDRMEDYTVIDSRWEGAECRTCSPQIYGENLENVAVTGRGVLDGQGAGWWRRVREGSLEYGRPRLICFYQCDNVLIEGITLKNSPAWTVNPILCSRVVIDRISIFNPPDSPNTDGINPDSCRNVHISNCHIDVGDDCITLKSGTETCSVKVPCENITVTNCTMMHGHGGVVIGSEMSGGVRNVAISNCIFEGTDRGIRIKSRRGRGGMVEDIRVDNIIMKTIMCPFVINMYYHWGPRGKEKMVWDKNPYPVSESTPIFRSIHFSNITVRDAGAAAGFIYGLAEMPVEDVSFRNISIYMAEDPQPDYPAMMDGIEPVRKKGFMCTNVKNLQFDHVRVLGNEGEAFTITNAVDALL